MKYRTRSLLRRWGALAAALLLAALLPLSALALDGTAGQLQWNLSGGVLTITGHGEIPDYTDAFMPPWYSVADAVTQIVVGEGITRVGDLAFFGCENAQSALLGSTVTEIGQRAFKNCKKLSHIDLPTGLKTIADAAFESCESLKTLTLPEGLQSIGAYAFTWSGLTSITVPASVTELGAVAFAYCRSLVRVRLLCPLTKLPDWTFYDCTALKDLLLPEATQQIGQKALDGCGRLNALYYDGTAQLIESGEQEPSMVTRKSTEEYPDTTESSTGDWNSSQTIKVTENDSVVITETVRSDYSYTLNGESVKLEELEDVTITQEDDFRVDTKQSTTVSATVKDASGWEQAVSAITLAAVRNEDTLLDARIYLQEPVLAGSDLAQLARKNAQITISTPSGSCWKMVGTDVKKKDFEDRDYDLDFTVEKLTENDTGIKASTVYALRFQDEIVFNSRVGIPVMVADSRQYASLYHRVGQELKLVQTVMVDTDARAWFALAAVDEETEYYVAINAEGIDADDVIIPDDLLVEYGGSTLMDADGISYVLTGRQSSWGMNFGSVTMVLVGVLIGSAVVIGTVMYAMNRRKLTRMKKSA